MLLPYAIWAAFPALAGNGDHDLLWTGTYASLLLGLAMFAARIRIGGVRLTTGPLPRTAPAWFALLAWGLGGFFAVMALGEVTRFLQAPLAAKFASVPSQGNIVAVPLDWSRIAMTLAYGCVMAPIVEELTFRGALLPAMATVFARQSVRIPFAVIGSSLAFAAGHAYGVPLWPTILVHGVVFCVLVYQTGSLIPAMLSHALYNGWVECHHMAILQAAFPPA